jgi:serine phosphatase RsbU (regulator of sigma subunit)/integral membrane sensor domain MASE1/anti-sigma regulatory factor (Ser/Thr protein kinase)
MIDTNQHRVTAPPPGAIWTWPDQFGRWSQALVFLLVVAVYVVGSGLALKLIEASGLQSVFFIPAGITVAFLLRLPRRHWWLVLVGVGVAEFAMDMLGGYTLAQSFGFSASNVAEPLVGATIVTAASGSVDLARRRHVLWFVFGAVILAPALGAAIGATTDRLFGGDDWMITFGQWWIGDALGVILVGSAILAWGSSQDRRSLWSIWGGLLIVSSVAFTVGIFGLTDLPLVFGVLVGVVGAGVVFGVRAVAMTALAIALTTAITLALDSDPVIVGLTPGAALVLVKLQIATFTVAGLLIAAESHERELATRAAARATLDSKAMELERRRNHELAVRIQRGLLPDRLLSKPGIDIAARYETASHALVVGGDWYDTIDLGGDRIGLAVGDIVGHGIDAMVSMGRLRTALTALALHNDEPASLLMELDEFVGGPSGADYATVIYVIVDLRRQSVQYASAGHPPGLLVSPDGSTIWLDKGQTEPLYGQKSKRHQASAPFEPGWSLILYSDGLVEQRGESLSVGLARLERQASRLASGTPDAMCTELFDSLVSGSPQGDDAVVLVLRNAMDSQEYHAVFEATPGELRNIRSSVRDWIAQRGLPPDVGDDLLIAVGEAASNSARHAYRGTMGGAVTIRITYVEDVVNAEVSDTGKWHDVADEEAYPGLGTQIMQSLTEGLNVDRTGRGTHVAFRIPLHRKPGTGARSFDSRS